MKRFVFVALAFLVGCNGIGSGSQFVPGGTSAGGSGANGLASAGNAIEAPGGHHGTTKVRISLRIPRRHREHVLERHPSSISSATQSVGFSINGGTAQIFNTTPTSPGCVATGGGTVCTFRINAAVGADTFAVTTYSAVGGGGSALDHGTALVNIVAGKNNTPSISLGPVVSSTADSGTGSLRYAIGTANAGDTIMFLIPAGSSVVLSSGPIVVNNNVAVSGPGVTGSHPRPGVRNERGTYSGVTISGGNSQQIFQVLAGGSLTLSGLILSGGKATVNHKPGGDIYNLGTVSLINDVLTGNSSVVPTAIAPHQKIHVPHRHHPGRNEGPVEPVRVRPEVRHAHCGPGTDAYGGAIYNDGTLNMSGTTFDSNIAPTIWSCYDGYGGAIYNDIYGVLSSVGDTYVNNSAYNGGAIYNYSEYGQATFTNDVFNGNSGCTAASGCTTSCSSPSSSCSVYQYGDGGAIYDDYGPGIVIANSLFEYNYVGGTTPGAAGYGGALYLDTGHPNISGTTFMNNVAGGSTSNCGESYGGAITVYEWLQLNNSTFINNQASGDEDGYGGAIYEDDYPIQGANDTFTSNAAIGSGSACASYGYGYGGAMYADYGTTLNNSTFTGNLASGSYEVYGGALYVDSTSYPMALTNVTFTSNAAIATGTTGESTYSYGGAAYVDDYTTMANVTFTSNQATVLGPDADEAEGGAYYADETTLSSRDTFTGNSASGSGYLYAYAYGGAVYNVGGWTSNADTFKSNTAAGQEYSYGGAIYNDDPLTMSNTVLTSNTATSQYYTYGGALYNYDSTTTVSNSNFTNNLAFSSGSQGYGGAVYDYSGMKLNGDVLSGNTASTGGGAIYDGASETINNSSIVGNIVSAAPYEYGGGGIYSDGPGTINNSTIANNVVTVTGTKAGGGGIYNDDDVSMYGSTVSGNVVHGNIGTSGGGGIFSDSDGTITNSTITGNSSSIDGGGVEQWSTGLSFYNDTLYQNAATGVGGNIANNDAMYLQNSIVAGGAAATGPDINNAASISSGDYNLIQTAVAGNALTGSISNNFPVGTNPLLLALTNNGGPTFTNADQQASPGRAAIPFTASQCNGAGSSTNVDQRGFTRGVATSGKCDVGAFEFGGTPMAIRVHSVPGKPPTHHKHHHQIPPHSPRPH